MNNRFHFLPFIFTLLLGYATSQGAEPFPKLLLLDIRPQGVPEDIAKSLTDLLSLEVERGHLYQVLSQSDLRTLLKVEEQRILLGIDGEDRQAMDAFAKIAKTADATFVLASSLGKVGNAYLLSLTLMDAGQAKVLRRVTQTLVGKQEELIGSLRGAVLALTLEEKGVSPDLSEALIGELKISEKSKAVFLSLSSGYEIPVGPVANDNHLLYLRPSFFHLRLDAEVPIWKWLRLFGSVSWANTIAAQHRMQDKHLAVVFDSDTQKPISEKISVITTTLDFKAQRIPVDFGVKIAPETGRFLPFVLLGVGVSWQQYTFSDEILSFLKEQPEIGVCPIPFADGGLITIHTNNNTLHIPTCVFGVEAHPMGALSYWNLDALVAAGAEWLLSSNMALRVEGRYNLAYAFKKEADLYGLFKTAGFNYELPGGRHRQDVWGDAFPVTRLQQGVLLTAGLIFYW